MATHPPDLTGDRIVTYYEGMDDVFKALADPTRRRLLDDAVQEGWATLSALQARLPMTRFGVMKHLRVLEEAGLVLTRRRGREKLHFLNPVPIRLVHDRWVSKYAEPWAATLSGLKAGLEDHDGEDFRDLHQDHPRATLAGDHRPGDEAELPVRVGVSPTGRPAPARRALPGAPAALFEGENLEVEPPRQLVQSFSALWGEEVKREGTSRVTWEIEPVGDSCRLTVTHDQLRDERQRRDLRRLAEILSGLKTLLETGGLLTTPGSLLYAKGPGSDA